MDGPVERIESLDTDLAVVVPVGATLKEELDQRWDVRTENGDFLTEVRAIEKMNFYKKLTRMRSVSKMSKS